MQKISTNTLTTRKHVEIDGHPFTVRKFGAGEQLRLNQLLRDMSKMDKQLQANPEDEALESRAVKLGQEMMQLFVSLFDDGGDGKKSRQLVESLNQEEVQELFNQIFNDTESTAEQSTDTDS